jgi:hypothetical protein
VTSRADLDAVNFWEIYVNIINLSLILSVLIYYSYSCEEVYILPVRYECYFHMKTFIHVNINCWILWDTFLVVNIIKKVEYLPSLVFILCIIY